MESKVSYTNSTKSALDFSNLFSFANLLFSFYSKIKVSTVNSNTMTVKDPTL